MENDEGVNGKSEVSLEYGNKRQSPVCSGSRPF